LPAPVADALWISRRARSQAEDVDQDVVVVRRVEIEIASDLGTPMQLPYPAIPETTPDTRYDMRGASGEPKRSESSEAIGRAPW